ncbi:amidohydrolase family-domain-containing protein [Mycena vitilis]|nr:amidohydrolase family-domain-containing protein [Mycena vitilis]
MSKSNGPPAEAQTTAQKPSVVDPSTHHSSCWVVIPAICALLLAMYLAGIPPLPSGYYALCSPRGMIYTVDSHNTKVDCLTINGSFITATGNITSVKLIPGLRIVYVPDDVIVVPGLSDAHGHLLEYGASRQLSLEGTKNLDETVARVREYILRTPSVLRNHDTFIRGGGWDHTSWPGAPWPTARAQEALEADSVIRGRPVVLQSKDCHALWVSPRVLQLSAPFPTAVEGGVVQTDENGLPTGVLLDNAQELCRLPALTEEEMVQRFTTGVKDALAYGLTAVHDPIRI